jgi:Domain of unknown function (DUF4253)
MATSLEQLHEQLNQSGISKLNLTLLWKVDIHNVYGFAINGSQAFNYWKQLYSVKDIISCYPLILGNPEDLENHQENLEFYNVDGDDRPVTVDIILERSLSIYAEMWFAETAQEQRQDCGNDDELLQQIDNGMLDSLTLAEVGSFNSTIQPTDESISIPYNVLTYAPYPTVWIALIPTTFSWQVPAFLKFGNWNSCPLPEVHVCLMNYWFEKYGAEVIGISHDVVEMQIKNPPSDRESAFRLAQEQYLYCADIVDQGCETLNNLAATLLNGKTWYFWWD